MATHTALSAKEELKMAAATLTEAFQVAYPEGTIRLTGIELLPEFTGRRDKIADMLSAFKAVSAQAHPERDQSNPTHDATGILNAANLALQLIGLQLKQSGVVTIPDDRTRAQLVLDFINNETQTRSEALANEPEEQAKKIAEIGLMGELMAESLGVSHQYNQLKLSAGVSRETSR